MPKKHFPTSPPLPPTTSPPLPPTISPPPPPTTSPPTTLVGTASNDTFTVTSFTTSIDGQGGTNTAIFADDISHYTITPSGSGFNVNNVVTGQVVTTVNVQILEFAGGGEVYYDQTGTFVPSSTGAVIGTAGNDLFTVTSAWTSVAGSGGSDTTIFSDDISHYTIAAASAGLNVTNVVTGQVVNLQKVQTFEFAGGSEVYNATNGTFVPSATGAVVGTAGNDTIAITSAMKSVDGAGGSNTVIFADDVSHYTVTGATAGVNLTNTVTGQVVNVQNVQTFEFAGGTEVYHLASGSSSSSGTPAHATSDFLSTLGVNTHLGNWTNVYENVSLVESSLAYLGIDHVRDGMRSSSHAQGIYDQVASSGIKFDFIIENGMDLPTFQSLVDSFATRHPGQLMAVEGPNEVDIQPFVYNGSSSLSSDAQFQKALYAAVKADPLLHDIPVYNLTLANETNASSLSQLGDLSTAADYANEHAYVWSGSAPYGTLQNYLAAGQLDAKGLPTVFTEAGYNNTLTDTMSGVDETVQAKYTLDTLLDDYKLGVAQTYLYELFDEIVDPTNPYANFGLFHNDGTPKLAATAIHDLTTVLKDPGGATSFTPDSLNYSLSGMPSSGNQLLLEKSNGTFDLMLWAEPKIWDPSTHTEIAAPTNDVTVDLGQVFNTVNVYDPLVGTTPIATYSNTQQLHVAVSDHPLVVEAVGHTTTTTDYHFV